MYTRLLADRKLKPRDELQQVEPEQVRVMLLRIKDGPRHLVAERGIYGTVLESLLLRLVLFVLAHICNGCRCARVARSHS